MKNTWYVWTKEPYGQWEKAHAKPSTHGEAAAVERKIQASGRPVKVLTLQSGEKPPEES